MTTSRAVSVKKLPEDVTLNHVRRLYLEIAPILEEDRPCLVFDCSEVRQIDAVGIEMLLRCMEEAMKRNGDVKLAAVSPQLAVMMELTRLDRLFEVFQNPSDAMESFHRFPLRAFQQMQALRDPGPTLDDANANAVAN
jgi:anti-sigma B factor antagonist